MNASMVNKILKIRDITSNFKIKKSDSLELIIDRFIKDDAIKIINYDEDISKAILNLFNEKLSSKLIENSQKHLSRYMKYRDTASSKLINLITKF